MKKNVLVVFCDELRRQSLGAWGNEAVHTPNIDRLAREGVAFKQACSTFPVCVPFRFTLMTGESAHSRCVPAIGYRMSPAERTLGDDFKEAGFETFYIGKWHLDGGPNALPGGMRAEYAQGPLPAEHLRSWDYFNYLTSAGRYSNNTYYINDEREARSDNEKHQVDFLFDDLADYLENRRSGQKPFFGIVSTNAPHPPYTPLAEDRERWEERSVELRPNALPEYIEHEGNIPEHEKKRYLQHLEDGTLIQKTKDYYAMIEHVDRRVGDIIEFLEKQRLYDTTAIVFMSDHGELIGSHGLTYCKQFPFEESIGIPLIISDPEFRNTGAQAVEQPVCTEDLYPTLLGLAGIALKKSVPGRSLVPCLADAEADLGREGVLLEFVQEARPIASLHTYAWRGVRTKRYKYTVIGKTSEVAHPWHFFDLETDPFEMHNLIGSEAHRDETEKHHQLLENMLAESGDYYPMTPVR